MLQSYKDIVSEKYNRTALQSKSLGEKNDFIFLFQSSFSFSAWKNKTFWKFLKLQIA